jgi:hypothetical protein
MMIHELVTIYEGKACNDFTFFFYYLGWARYCKRPVYDSNDHVMTLVEMVILGQGVSCSFAGTYKWQAKNVALAPWFIIVPYKACKALRCALDHLFLLSARISLVRMAVNMSLGLAFDHVELISLLDPVHPVLS